MVNKTPDWFKKSAVYQINPRTFCEEGTIQAVTKQLPVLAELGFKIMYLCPIFQEDDSEDLQNWSTRQKASQTGNPKNPYRMNDYFQVDSEYGTMDDLREFVQKSHGLGMRVILDLVYLHIGPNAGILKSFPDFAAKNEDGTVKCTRWNFPYLNYENQGLREYLWSNMTYYIGAIGVDGFRCDVGDAVPLDFWKEGVRRIRTIKPDAVMINEGEKAEYLSVFDANYGFYWHNCLFDILTGAMTAKGVMEKYAHYKDLYPAGGIVLRDMDNHDTVTDWPYRIEEHFGNACMELILAMNYTIDGVPMVYCGNELADQSKLSMFANRFYPGVFECTDRNATGEPVARRKEIIKKLNALKAEVPALADGETEWIPQEHASVLAFMRVGKNEQVLFAGNFSEDAAQIQVDSGEVLLSNNSVIENGTVSFSAYGYVIMRKCGPCNHTDCGK